MFYIALSNVSQNIERVAMRVKNGGHHIPTEDIIRRSKTSFTHLYDYAYLIDNLVLIDNSEDDGEIVLEINNGIITFEATNLPQWSHPVSEQFKKN
jgi:predicted ABC-type ATPase